jgi:hypothetical protein
VTIGLHIKNSDKKTVAPRIDATLSFMPLSASSDQVEWALVNFSGERDPFPALEVYRISQSGSLSTVLQDPSGGFAAASLTPFGPNHNWEVVSAG